MSPSRGLAVAVAAAAIVVVAAVLVSFPRGENSPTVAQEGDGSITIITISGGSLLAGASYSITPDPRGGTGAYAVQDGGEGDANPAAGTIEIRKVSAGNYTVAQSEAPPGYGHDKLSKVIEVKGAAATATFSNAVAGTASPQPKSLIYTAKFECGTISGSEGPLRPGHYDTDIGILNKQDFEVRLTWNAVLKDGKGTNSILKVLEPQATTGIVCSDIRKLVGGEKFAEGFIIIAVPLDAGLQGALAGGSTVVGRQSMDLLDVQVFYTANALLELPHEVLVDKIVFAVTGDPSGKVPAAMIGRTLDVTVRSGYEISDPEDKVRKALAEQYGLSGAEAGNLAIRIDSISVGAGTLMDDHALSLSRVLPQIAS
ncbi:MAG: hypothetical protein ACREAY_10420 [Nitrososphaera sp.]|uniref:hypothetical protein n=1 Tax=Nitrososphaera sp. TaxID=1971748 RepID=UPI003D6DAEDF